jgi:hypothetical protein
MDFMDEEGCSGYLKVLSANHPAHQAGIRRKSRKYATEREIASANCCSASQFLQTSGQHGINPVHFDIVMDEFETHTTF